MSNVENHIEMLGKRATDKITGYKGTITSIGFDLFGCIQVVITPNGKEGEEYKSGTWFDINRIKITNHKRKIPIPDYSRGYQAEGKQGCVNKSSIKSSKL